MDLAPELEAFWKELETERAEVLSEVEGLSQAQFDWRPAASEWSIGEVIHHLTLAEIATGKLTTTLLREAEARGVLTPRPEGRTFFDPLPPPPTLRPTGEAETPAHIWPAYGHSKGDLLAGITAARERSRRNFERVAVIDPRPLVRKHAWVGDLHLGQYWAIVPLHDRKHVQQIRDVKAARGFPKA